MVKVKPFSFSAMFQEMFQETFSAVSVLALYNQTHEFLCSEA